MARAIGLDIGARAIKVVELAGSAKAPKIQRLAIREIPLPPPAPAEGEEVEYDRDAAVVEIIRDIFGTLQLPTEDVCATFDSGVSIFREITVPFFEPDQIRKVVRFEAENHLHSHVIDDVVVNWVKTGETRDGSRLTIFASPKIDLARRIAILRQADITVASIDLDTTALYTTLDSAGILETHPNVIVIDVGAHTTNLILTVDGKPRVMRSFLLGVGALESDVAHELGVSAAEGRRQALHGGGPAPDDLLVPAVDLARADAETEKSLTQLETDVVGERRLEFVRKLHREAIRSLSSVRSDSPPEKILLVGGGALLPEVAEHLGERFGLPVERLNLLDHVECKTSEHDPVKAGAVLGPAIGCGLRMLGAPGLGVELLRDEFAPKNVFEVVRMALTTAVTLLFLVVLGITAVEKQKHKAEQRTFNNWVYAAKQIFFKVEPAYLREVTNEEENAAQAKTKRWLDSLPKDHTQVNRIRTRLLGRYRDLQDLLGLAKDITQLPSALEAMVEIYKALSSQPREALGSWFEIQKLRIRERGVNMTIVVDNVSVLETVRKMFQASEYLRERSQGSTVAEFGTLSDIKGTNYKRQDITFKFKD